MGDRGGWGGRGAWDDDASSSCLRLVHFVGLWLQQQEPIRSVSTSSGPAGPAAACAQAFCSLASSTGLHRLRSSSSSSTPDATAFVLMPLCTPTVCTQGCAAQGVCDLSSHTAAGAARPLPAHCSPAHQHHAAAAGPPAAAAAGPWLPAGSGSTAAAGMQPAAPAGVCWGTQERGHICRGEEGWKGGSWFERQSTCGGVALVLPASCLVLTAAVHNPSCR